MDVKRVALCQLVDVRKQLGTRHAAVSRQHRMGAAAAHRQRCADHMANRLFQRVRVRAVLHRQIYVDFGDVYIGHGAAHRELLGIGQGRGGCPSLCNGCTGQHGVVLLCGFTLGSQLGVVGICNGLGVGGFHIRMILFTQKFSHQRVKQKPQRHSTASRRQYPAFHCSCLCLRDLTTMKAAVASRATPPMVNIHVP